MPWTATISPCRSDIFRRLSLDDRGDQLNVEEDKEKHILNVETPAQSRGAADTGSMPAGTRQTASVRRVTYSAYAPSVKIPK